MRKPFPNYDPHSLLIMRLSSLGDILHVLPAYKALRENLHFTRIYWVVDEQYQEMIEDLPGLKEALPFDRKNTSKKLKALTTFWSAIGIIWSFIKLLRSKKFSGSLDFHGLFRSGLFASASGTRRRLAFRSWREGNRLFQNWTKKAPKQKMHVIEKHVEMLKMMGIEAKPERMELPVPDEAKKEIETYLIKNGIAHKKYVLIFPTSRKKIKQWSIEGYAETARRIKKEMGLTPLIVQDLEQKEFADKIAHASGADIKVTPLFMVKALAELSKHAAFAVGCDTGPLHLAAAMGTPVVGIYGPTDPEIFGPYWEPNRVVQHKPDCNRKCWKRRNREDARCECLEALGPDKVFDACLELYGEISKESNRKDESA